eukprot:2170858-Rhodomonas_salina.2
MKLPSTHDQIWTSSVSPIAILQFSCATISTGCSFQAKACQKPASSSETYEVDRGKRRRAGSQNLRI